MNETTSSRPPKISQDTMKKIMWLYRTRNCPLNKRGQCNYGVHCFDSHETHAERRAPKQNQYNDWHPSKMQCTSNAASAELCKYGRACTFAHNEFEIEYHPTSYKTKPCAQFQRDETCDRGMICPHYHYAEEQRKSEDGSLCSDCKSDGLSRKAPPPQEYRRWLDRWLKRGTNTAVAPPPPEKKAMTIADTLLAMSLEHEEEEKEKQEEEEVCDAKNNHEVEMELPDASHSNLSLRNVSLSPHPLSPALNDASNEQPAPVHKSQSPQIRMGTNAIQNNGIQKHPQSTAHAVAVPSVKPSSTRSTGNRSLKSNQSAKSKKSSSAHSSSKTSKKSHKQPQQQQKKQQSIEQLDERDKPKTQKTANRVKEQRHHERNKRRKQRAQIERDSIQLMKTYKVNPCRNGSKCTDVLCPHFHSGQDRRRCPFAHIYSHTVCPTVFDLKTRKFVGDASSSSPLQCPMRDGCGYAHNYMEVWYHPNTFHTKQCPLIQYQQPCPWNFQCSHYHRKLHKRKVSATATATVAPPPPHPANGHQHIKQQPPQQQPPPQLKSHQEHGNSVMYAVQPHAVNGTSALNTTPHSLAHSQFDMTAAAAAPVYEAVPVASFEAEFVHQSPINAMPSNYNNSNAPQSYSFNPLMQGIAPSIHSWRQKTNNSIYQ